MQRCWRCPILCNTVAAASFTAFPAKAPDPIVSRLGESSVSLMRVGMGQQHDHLDVRFESQDAFYVIFQLQEQPAHAFWEDGRLRPAPVAPRGSLHIADMNAAPAAVINGRFDSINILLPRSYLDSFADDNGVRRVARLHAPVPWRTQDPILAQLAPLFVQAMEQGNSVGRLFIDQLATAAVAHLCGRYGGMQPHIPRLGGLAPWQERRAREMIAAHLTKETSLAEIASACNLSLTYFSKAFKVSTGMTPNAWLQACRIDKARELLSRAAMGFSDIALICGFADQSHLIRVFKRATGMTPGVWRRNSRS
jgi:AraC family transcriptional regulator